MLRHRLLLLLLLIGNTLYSQHETANWFFGRHAALLFQNDSVITAVNPNMNTMAGCSSISDSTGNLLLYSDGMKLWDFNHQIITDSITAHQGINPNSVFVPFPGETNKYYLFTVKKDKAIGLSYTLIDLSNGSAEIQEKNKFITSTGLDRVAVIRHCNGKYFWVVVHSLDLQNFEAYLVNESGIQSHPVVSACHHHEINNTGPLKFSPESSRLIVPVSTGNILAAVYLFDNATGEILPGGEIYREPYTYVCGVSFSPSGKFLYLTTGGHYYKLLQYDLSGMNNNFLNNSKVLIANGNVYGLQLAANGKIYVSKMNMPYLDCISQPENKGSNCSLVRNAVALDQGMAQMHLPSFVQSWLYKPHINMSGFCKGDTTFFSPSLITKYDSIAWMLSVNNGGNYIFSRQTKSSLLISDTGTYNIQLKIYRCTHSDSVKQSIRIADKPSIPQLADTFLTVEPLQIILTSDYDSIFWNGSHAGNIYHINSEGIYSLLVFKDGCSASDTLFVEEPGRHLYFPNAFTPNNDGLNDTFKPVSQEDISGYELYIFSRNGQMLFNSKLASSGWDGRFKGNECPRDVYIWKTRYIPKESSGEIVVENGTLLLIR